MPILNARTVIAVDAIGHRVPRDFDGRVHSTFVDVCNIACGDALLSLVGSVAGHGPTSLCMTAGSRHDLRRLYDVGEPVRCAHGIAHSARAEIRLSQARVWRPAPLRVPLPPELLLARLQRAHAALTQQRQRCTSVLEGAAAPVAAELLDACADCDAAAALQHVERLIGWGEGLTPAGDDFLVGVCAGLDAFIGGDAQRRTLRAALGDAVVATACTRTTTISAHYLRLAAAGHYAERLLAARDALLGEPSWPRVDDVLRAACAIGATSGCDAMAGLLGALAAWSPIPAAVESV